MSKATILCLNIGLTVAVKKIHTEIKNPDLSNTYNVQRHFFATRRRGSGLRFVYGYWEIFPRIS